MLPGRLARMVNDRMRTIYIGGDTTGEFILSVLPKYIVSEVGKKLKAVAAPRREEMDDYLGKEGLPSVAEIMSKARDSILITSKSNEALAIMVDGNAVVGGKPLMPLVKLVEYGNMDIRGLHFINAAIDGVRRNLNDLYHLYEMGRIS